MRVKHLRRRVASSVRVGWQLGVRFGSGEVSARDAWREARDLERRRKVGSVTIQGMYAADPDGSIWLNVTDAIQKLSTLPGLPDDAPILSWLRNVEAVGREHKPT